jgi:hypothetical protein
MSNEDAFFDEIKFKFKELKEHIDSNTYLKNCFYCENKLNENIHYILCENCFMLNHIPSNGTDFVVVPSILSNDYENVKVNRCPDWLGIHVLKYEDMALIKNPNSLKYECGDKGCCYSISDSNFDKINGVANKDIEQKLIKDKKMKIEDLDDSIKKTKYNLKAYNEKEIKLVYGFILVYIKSFGYQLFQSLLNQKQSKTYYVDGKTKIPMNFDELLIKGEFDEYYLNIEIDMEFLCELFQFTKKILPDNVSKFITDNFGVDNYNIILIIAYMINVIHQQYFNIKRRNIFLDGLLVDKLLDTYTIYNKFKTIIFTQNKPFSNDFIPFVSIKKIHDINNIMDYCYLNCINLDDKILGDIKKSKIDKSPIKNEVDIVNNKDDKNFTEFRFNFKNNGATCYVNATLQLILHMPKFYNYLFTNNINSGINYGIGDVLPVLKLCIENSIKKEPDKAIDIKAFWAHACFNCGIATSIQDANTQKPMNIFLMLISKLFSKENQEFKKLTEITCRKVVTNIKKTIFIKEKIISNNYYDIQTNDVDKFNNNIFDFDTEDDFSGGNIKVTKQYTFGEVLFFPFDFHMGNIGTFRPDKYLDEITFQSKGTNTKGLYELYGVGMRTGTATFGHFWSIIKFNDGKWYKLNDAHTTESKHPRDYVKDDETCEVHVLAYRKKN